MLAALADGPREPAELAPPTPTSGTSSPTPPTTGTGYAGLEDLVRDGRHVDMHTKAADDPYWRSYIRGQFQIARLSSAEVAKAIPLAAGAHSILGLFFLLTSGADTYTTEEVSLWLRESGYAQPAVKSFRTIPDLRLLVAKAA
jgi:hypothetical protein